MASTRWTGRGDGVRWSDPANWSAGLPTAGIDARYRAGDTGTVELAGSSQPLSAGALIVQGDTLGLANGVLNLEPQPAQSGNTIDLALEKGAHLTVEATARVYGSHVAEIGKGTGATLTVLGLISEQYGVVRHGTLDVSGPKGHWLSGDSGLYFQDSNLVVEDGGRVDTGGKLAQFPAAALFLDGDCSALVTGAGSTVRLQNTFMSQTYGTSTLTIEDGGRVFCGGGQIGGNGDATLTVTGAGSLFSASRGLQVGGQVPVNSKLVVEDGGTVRIGQYGLQLAGDLVLDEMATFKAPSILSRGGTIEASLGNVLLSSRLELFHNESAPFETKTTYLVADEGATLTLSGAISSAIPGDTSETLDAASGHIVLAHNNKGFGGKIAIYGARLEIAAAWAAGTGGVDFVGGSTAATLQIDNGLAFHNAISNFGPSDQIDLAGFLYDCGGLTERWTPNDVGGTLTLTNADHQRQSLSFIGDGLSAASFGQISDGHGGTTVIRT